jgi:glycerol-3-phosphate cytidylyltransferase
MNFTGRDYCEEKGIELFFNSRYHCFSSSSLREKVVNKKLLKKS